MRRFIVVTATATTMLLRYHVPYGASLSTVRKLSRVGASGQNVGGIRRISACGLKARTITTNGMTKMMVTTTKRAIKRTGKIQLCWLAGRSSSVCSMAQYSQRVRGTRNWMRVITRMIAISTTEMAEA